MATMAGCSIGDKSHLLCAQREDEAKLQEWVEMQLKMSAEHD